MKQFEASPSVLLSSRQAKKIVKQFNKVARTLVAFEFLWYDAWCKSVDASRQGPLAS